MKLEVKYSSKFKKGLKLAKRRGLDISLLENVVEKCQNTENVIYNLIGY